MNLVTVLLRSTAAEPDAPAFIDGDRTVTYAELEALAASTAGSLARLGVTPGDRVAIASGNDLAFVTTYLGALWAGGVGSAGVPRLMRSTAAVNGCECSWCCLMLSNVATAHSTTASR